MYLHDCNFSIHFHILNCFARQAENRSAWVSVERCSICRNQKNANHGKEPLLLIWFAGTRSCWEFLVYILCTYIHFSASCTQFHPRSWVYRLTCVRCTQFSPDLKYREGVLSIKLCHVWLLPKEFAGFVLDLGGFSYWTYLCSTNTLKNKWRKKTNKHKSDSKKENIFILHMKACFFIKYFRNHI